MSDVSQTPAPDKDGLVAAQENNARNQASPLTQEIRDVYGPEATVKKLSEGVYLKANLSSDTVAKTAEISPQVEHIKNHLKDIHGLVEGMEDNPNFQAEMQAKMVQTKSSIEHLGEHTNALKQRGAAMPHHKPCEDNAEMLLQILSLIFGKKNQLSSQEKTQLEAFERAMELMRERMQEQIKGMKEYEQAQERKNVANESNSMPSPGSGPSLSR